MKKNYPLIILCFLTALSLFTTGCSGTDSDNASVVINIDGTKLLEHIADNASRNPTADEEQYTLTIRLSGKGISDRQSAVIPLEKTSRTVIFSRVPVNSIVSVKASVMKDEICVENQKLRAYGVTYYSGQNSCKITEGDNNVAIKLDEQTPYTLKVIHQGTEQQEITINFSDDSKILLPLPENFSSEIEGYQVSTQLAGGIFITKKNQITTDNGILLQASSLKDYITDGYLVIYTTSEIPETENETPDSLPDYFYIKMLSYDYRNADDNTTEWVSAKNNNEYYYSTSLESYTDGTNVWMKNTENEEEWQNVTGTFSAEDVKSTVSLLAGSSYIQDLESAKSAGLAENTGTDTIAGFECQKWIVYNKEQTGDKTPFAKFLIESKNNFILKYSEYNNDSNYKDNEGFVTSLEVTEMLYESFNWNDMGISIPE